MIIRAPLPLDQMTLRGLRQLVRRAEVVMQELAAMGDSEIDVCLGKPAFRFPLSVRVVRHSVQRRIDAAYAAIARRMRS